MGDVAGGALEHEARQRHARGDYAGAVAGYEAAFARYGDEGDLLGAARAARTVGWLRGWVFGEWAVYQGWSARAQALLERADDASAQGWLRYAHARRGVDLATQRAQYREAVELARQAGDADLECEATAGLGMMLVFSGLVEEGMAHLDHALAAVCGGEVRELPVVEGCLCGLLHACERTQDVQRAEQWLGAATEVVRRDNLLAVAGHCRAHYAGILVSAGRWVEAERELLAALAQLPEGTAVRASALCRLADLRLRQGRPDEAAVLLHGLEDHEDARLTLVALRAGQAGPEVAVELLDRFLGAGDLPDYAEAPLLARKVEHHLALGELDAARAASDRLTALAGAQRAPAVRALAAAARGRVCVATGAGDPRACWHEALSQYAQAAMPVEVARCRLELARVLAAGRPAAALAEASEALAAFESFGAARSADEAAALVRSLGGPARTGPKRSTPLTRREEEVLDLVGHGLTNAAIGARLFISPKTVEHHVSRIRAKLGLRTRTETAAYAARSGHRPPVG